MDERISLVTLPVDDLRRAKDFYAAMGWSPAAEPDDEICFYQALGMVFSIWERAAMSKEAQTDVPRGTNAVAQNVRTEPEVDEILDQAEAAGATIVRRGTKMEWGGYSGAFRDPDDNYWEIATNPFWEIGPDGAITITA